MPRHAPLSLAFLLVACGTFAALAGEPSGTDQKPAEQLPAANPAPGLRVGDSVPDAELRTITAEPVKLSSLYASGPVVITFYRGGWCPYCNKALDSWQEKLSALKAAAPGASLVALTPEKPTLVHETITKHSLGFTVLSDSKGDAARAFKVLFSLPPELQAKYKGFKVDLTERNAMGTWELPHPGTFVVDAKGVVRYAFVDPDYRHRADPDEVIRALAALTP